MNSIFGEFETPGGKHAPPVASAITLKVYSALRDPSTERTEIRAEATCVGESMTALTGCEIVFFLNGDRLATAVSDEFGMAVLKTTVHTGQLMSDKNELAARVAGSRAHAVSEFQLTIKQIKWASTSVSWKREIARTVYRLSPGAARTDFDRMHRQGPLFSPASRREGLTVQGRILCHESVFPLSGVPVLFRVKAPNGHNSITLMETTFDERGLCQFDLRKHYYDAAFTGPDSLSWENNFRSTYGTSCFHSVRDPRNSTARFVVEYADHPSELLAECNLAEYPIAEMVIPEWPGGISPPLYLVKNEDPLIRN